MPTPARLEVASASNGGIVLTAIPGNGFVPIRYTLDRTSAVELARRLLAFLPNLAPIQAVIEITPQSQPVPPPNPTPPPAPPAQVPIDPAFAALEAARANKEAARTPVSPQPSPPSSNGTGTVFGKDSQ